MKKLLNTLYITSPEASLKKDRENVVVEIEGDEKLRVPLHMLASIVCMGPKFISPSLIGACTGKGICIVFLSRFGRFEARVEGPVSGNVLLRRAQYMANTQPEAIVKMMLLGKVSNQRMVLMRTLRDYKSEMSDVDLLRMQQTTARMAMIIQRFIKEEDSLDSMRGYEGEAARLYFDCFNILLRSPDKEVFFKGRTRRPPLDPVNAVLSFLYTLLTHDCRSGAEAVGLDPAVGFLHRDRPGRPSLALDLMEELRPILADRAALSLFNRRQLRAKDFVTDESGAVRMSDDARKTILETWQERKKSEVMHPFLNEKAPIGLVPYLQAQVLARYLRGDIDAYPPYFGR